MFLRGHPPPLALSLFLPPLQHRSPSSKGRGLIKIPDLGLSFTFCTFSSNRFLINYHLLQEEMSLLRDEQWTDVWV